MIVTRTMPLGNGGRFTKECREVYEVVLEMQEVSARSLLSLSSLPVEFYPIVILWYVDD